MIIDRILPLESEIIGPSVLGAGRDAVARRSTASFYGVKLSHTSLWRNGGGTKGAS